MLTLILVWSLAQEFTYDINGRRVAAPPSPNGQSVQPPKVEEKVLEQSGGRKVIERLVRRTTADGAVISTEKVRIEEVTHSDGRVTTSQETFRSDVNGRMALAEKSFTDFKKTGDHVEAVTTVSRGTLNGGLEVVERALMSGREDAQSKNTDTRVFRKDHNGGFREAVRNVVEQTTENGQTVERNTEYQAATVDGKMGLSGQRVTTQSPSSGGASVKQVRIYGLVQPGRPSGGALQLREEQLVEQSAGPGQTVQENFSIRRPDVNGNVPRNFTPISQRTCQQKCTP